MSTSSPPPPAAPRAVASDFSKTTFDREAVVMTELFRAALRSGAVAVSGRRFSDCLIEGPAVLLLAQGVALDDCDLGDAHGDLDTLLLKPLSPTRVSGTIPLVECTFERCHFLAIGFTGSDVTLDMLRQITRGPGG